MAEHVLFLLRHAQAAATAGGQGDSARKLTRHGLAQAREVGTLLADREVGLILCSTAKRAIQTAEQLDLGTAVSLSDELYNAGSQSILAELAEVDESVTTVLVVGHAPGVPALAHLLADETSDAEALDAVDSHFPPATLVGLEFDGPWDEVRSARLFLAEPGGH